MNLKKSNVYRSIFGSFLLLLISACGYPLADWTPYDGFKELPYANGKPTQAKYRPYDCPMCVTGVSGKVKLFEDNRCSTFQRSFSVEEVSIKAEELLTKAIPKDKWTYIGKTFVKTDRYFLPIRIFVPSVDPLVLAVIPWQYDASKVKNPRYIHDLADKYLEDELIEKSKSNRRKYIAIGWPSELFLPIEIRSSTPTIPEEIRFISEKSDKTIETKNLNDLETINLDLESQNVELKNSNGKLTMKFNSIKSKC